MLRRNNDSGLKVDAECRKKPQKMSKESEAELENLQTLSLSHAPTLSHVGLDG